MSVPTGTVLVFLLASTLMCTAKAADPSPPLVLERTIPLAGVAGSIDHMAVDLARKCLIVAELGNNTGASEDLRRGAHRALRIGDGSAVRRRPRRPIGTGVGACNPRVPAAILSCDW